MMDVKKLERDLDNNIFIDGMKLFVNSPRFDRGKVYRAHSDAESSQKVVGSQEKQKGKQQENRGPCYGDRPRSYLEVVKDGTLGEGSLHQMKEAPQGINKEKQSSVVLNSNMADSEWLQKAWVGRLEDHKFTIKGFAMIRRYPIKSL